MFYTYILQSLSTGRYYVGSTENIEQRVEKHNSGSVKSTKPYRPWKLVYSKMFESRSEAVVYELKIKKMKSRSYIKELINSG